MKKLAPVLGAAAVAASFIGGALHAGREAPAVQDSRERDLFSFVRSLPPEDSAMSDPAPQVPEAAIDPQWKNLFNRYLIPGSGQQAGQVRPDIEQKLEGLPAAEKALAKSLLDQYLRYRQEMAPLQAAMDSPRDAAALAEQIRALQEMRARVFAPREREAFFRTDEEYESLMLARREIGEDVNLTEEQKHLRLQQLEASASPGARMAEEERTGVVRLSPEPVIAPSADGEEGIYRLAGSTP
ncbi:MAG TPA: lipase secretion chaperone [Noviherbaspirillum sp.]|nr:lipase secretion chaperone [Noviherbaspirillum sp.]